MLTGNVSGSRSSSRVSQISVSPLSIAFGRVKAGTASAKTITLNNSGAADVTVSSAGVTGKGFSVQGLAMPLTLAAGQSASLTVTFAPEAAGDVAGSVSVASTAANSPAAVAVSGTGEVESLSANPSGLSFGSVGLGGNSALPVVLSNTGNTSITISQVAATGAGFSVSGPALPLTLAAGQNTSFSVTFAPTSTGSSTGNLSVVSDASNSPAAVSLSATGAGRHSVTLSWAPSASSGIKGYNIYRGIISGGPYSRLDSSPVTVTNYTDSTVEAGETYYYVMTALDADGDESAHSNQASAVVPLP
ncbi:MAG TPA: choice-of-anchor D domain-containing protein [Terriglobia bacterium]|nr:choice-of-anchor D domain-containing protein [Terriglobia bacterium]